MRLRAEYGSGTSSTLYLTYSDICKGVGGENKTVLAIKNTLGGTLEVPDPEEGMGWGTRKYQMFLSTSAKVAKDDNELLAMGAADICAISKFSSHHRKGRLGRKVHQEAAGKKEIEVFLLQGGKVQGVAEETEEGGSSQSTSSTSTSSKSKTKSGSTNPNHVSNESSIQNTPTLNPAEAPVILTEGKNIIKLLPIEHTDIDYTYHMPTDEGISDFFT